MRKYFICRNSGGFAQVLEHLPYMASVKRITVAAYKNRAAFYIVFADVPLQHTAKRCGEDYNASFPLAADTRLPRGDGICRNKAQLGNPYAR